MSSPAAPAGWVTTRLDAVTEVRLGRQRSPKNHSGKQMRPYLRAANLTWGGINIEDVKEMNFTDAEVDTYRLRDGDLLLSEASGSAKEVGKPGVWHGQSAGEVCFQNTLIRVRPEAGISSDFLYYRLLHEALRGGFIESSRGVGIHHLGATKVAALKVAVAPRNQQIRIAAELDVQFARLDKVVKDLDALLTLLKVTRQRVIESGCQGRLPGGGVPDDAAAEVELALGHLPDGPDEPVPALPEGWIWATLGGLAQIAGGVTKDSKKQDDPSFVEVPYLRVANVQAGRLLLDEVSKIRVPPGHALNLRLQPGDVLMNEGGDRDKLGRGWVWQGEVPNCIHQNHVFRARIRESVLEPKFLSWHGNTYGRTWFEANGKQTTNLASISLSNLKRLPVPVPPQSEQRRIVALIDSYLRLLDDAEAAGRALQLRVDLFKRALLRLAFSGQLLAPEASDQEAAALIEDIRAKREAATGIGLADRPRKLNLGQNMKETSK